jgi:alpha-beta hydrolase superfamily lysophospholipase
VILLSLAATLLASQSISGDWQGYWSRAGDTMPVTLHIRGGRDSGSAATFDSERLRVSGIPFNELVVQRDRLTMVVRGDRTTSTFSGTVRGDAMRGTFSEDGEPDGFFFYRRVKNPPPPFEEREIIFNNGPLNLAGSLLLPPLPKKGVAKPVPAVVFIQGSGAEGRWASRFLATQVVARGMAAFIYDKRGVGKSQGDWHSASPADLTQDAVAAIARVRLEPRIDAKRIGIHGHSQGGTLAPMIAVQSPDVAFIVASAAAAIPMDSVELFSLLNYVYPRATTAQDSADAHDYATELVAMAYRGRSSSTRFDSLVCEFNGRPWYFAPPPPEDSYWMFSRLFAQYRPLDWWAKVRVPVLLMYGTEDQRVPGRASSARIWATLQRAAPQVSLTVYMVQGADHTFRLPPGRGGWPRTAPDYLPTLLDWLQER